MSNTNQGSVLMGSEGTKKLMVTNVNTITPNAVSSSAVLDLKEVAGVRRVHIVPIFTHRSASSRSKNDYVPTKAVPMST